MKCERENKTLKIQNKWENYFLTDVFIFIVLLYITTFIILLSMNAAGYVSHAIMQSALYLKYFSV